MPFGLGVRVTAGRDSDRMASGVMVREGEHQTREAWVNARSVILLSGLATLLSCCRINDVPLHYQPSAR